MTTNGPAVGISLSSSIAPENLPHIAALAERLGFAELWPVEDYFCYGGISGALSVLGATSGVPVGLGVVSALARHPALLAMEIATLERLHPGRIWPGIGLGVPSWVEQMGFRPSSPVTVVRECVTSVTRLLAGEEVTFEGKVFQFEHVKLVHPPQQRPPIYMGVIGPKMLQLAGEIADGTVVSVLASAAYVRWLRERIDEGRTTAGRTEPHRVATFALYGVDTDGRRAKEALRQVTAFYLAAVPKSALTDVYGVADELTDMVTRGGADAAALIAREMPDQWIEDLVIAGDPEECAVKIQALLDAGSDSVCLYPVPVDRVEEIMTMTAREVLPRIGSTTGVAR